MTPEQRAKMCFDTIVAFGWEVRWKHDKPIPADAWPKDIIQRELEKSFSDGRASTRFDPIHQF